MRPLGAASGVGGEHGRVALALAGYATVACASYAAQRLGAWVLGDPGADPGSLFIDFTWRLGLSVLHGAVAAAVLGLAVREERARAWLDRAGPVGVGVVALCAAAMVAVP